MREVKNMNLACCNYKCSCTAVAVVVSVILGVIAAFLQITGVIALTPVLLAVAAGVATVYLGALVLTLLLVVGLDFNAGPFPKVSLFTTVLHPSQGWRY